MPGLPGNLRRLYDQGNDAARHQQDEGDAGKQGGQGGSARPDAGDQDAGGEGSADGDGKHAQHSGGVEDGGDALQPSASQMKTGAMMIEKSDASTCRPTA